MWKYCKICCVSKTIYIKEKKSTNERPKKKNCNYCSYSAAGTVATVWNKKKKKKGKMPHQISIVDEQCKYTEWTVPKLYAAFYI